MTASTILPKTHCVNTNWLPSAYSSSIVSVLPSSPPSTPPAVVSPVNVNPPQLSSTNSIDSGKLAIFNIVDDSKKTTLSTSERDCEVIETEVTSVNETAAQSSAITSPPKVSKPRIIAMDSSEILDLGSPSSEGYNANTLHLEIFSVDSLSEYGDAEMAGPSFSVNQEESLIGITAPRESETNVINNIGQARSVINTHNDSSKPISFTTVPASGNGTTSQLPLKTQPAPITVQTATQPSRLVSAGIGDQVTKTSIATTVKRHYCPLLAKTIQVTPVLLTNSMNALQQKPKISDRALLGQDVVLVKNSEQKIRNEVLVLKSLQPETISLTPTKLPATVNITVNNEGTLPLKMNNDVMALKSVQLQNGSAPTVGTGDQLTSNNLALHTTRQYFDMECLGDMVTVQEEIRVPRCISYPACNVKVVDASTQTSLFSLLERGRLVEMTSADGKGANVGPTVTMASSTVQQTNSTSVGKPSTSKGKRVVSVDSAGRVVTIGASSSPSEPVCKKLKLRQTEPNPSDKVKRPSTDSSVCQNTNKQTVKSNNGLMVCDNIIQQHYTATQCCSSNCSELEQEGVVATVVDPSDILPNRHVNNIPKVFSINKEFVLQSSFKDWKNSLVPDEDGNFPLHNAVIDEDLNQVKRQCFILEARKKSVDIQNAEKQTPLHLAVLLGSPQIVQTLLKFGARPEIVDCKGNNALHLATEECINFACLQILLNECNCKPFINTVNHDGFSPLHLCATAGKCEESLALIKKGADTNLRDAKSGGTALFHAVEAGNFDISRLLVQYGASAHVPSYAGQTPMSSSVYRMELQLQYQSYEMLEEED